MTNIQRIEEIQAELEVLKQEVKNEEKPKYNSSMQYVMEQGGDKYLLIKFHMEYIWKEIGTNCGWNGYHSSGQKAIDSLNLREAKIHIFSGKRDTLNFLAQ